MTDVRRSTLGTALLAASLLLCQFSFAIEQTVGVKIGYPIALVLLAVVAMSYRRYSRRLALACVIALLVCCQMVIQLWFGVEFGAGWKAAAFAYTGLPILVLAIDPDRIDLNKVLWAMALSVIPSCLGLILQLVEAAPPGMDAELTSTAGEVIVRYNSVYGSSLLFGMSGFVQLVSAWRLLSGERPAVARVILMALMVAALTCIGFSYARRAYLSVAVALAFTVGARILSRRRKAPISLRRVVGFGLLAASFGVLVAGDESIRSRIVSSVDVTEDEGNVLRIQKWMLALALVAERPMVGSGPGVLSAVGKSKEEIGTAEDAEIAEMLYLTILTDLGIVVGMVLTVLLVVFSLDRLRSSPYQRLVTGPLVVEGIVGTALFNPFILVFFLLAASYARNTQRGFRESEYRATEQGGLSTCSKGASPS